MKCWGYGANGQLGYGDTQNRGDSGGEMGDNLRAFTFAYCQDYCHRKAFTTPSLRRREVLGLWGNGQLGYGDTRIGATAAEMGKSHPRWTGDWWSAKHRRGYPFASWTATRCWGCANGQLGYLIPASRRRRRDGRNLPSVDLGSGRSAKFIAAGDSHTVRSWTTAA